MLHVLDDAPARELAQEAASLIEDPSVAFRFARIARRRIVADPQNFRPAEAHELLMAPSWAAAARARGDVISVCAPTRRCRLRIRTVARRLNDACHVASTSTAARPDDAAHIEQAQMFLAKIDRANFDVTARKALRFANIWEDWQETPCEQVRDAREIPHQDRIWRCVVSLAELRAVGKEFRNCLRHAGLDERYGIALTRRRADFWVLRDARGNGLMVAMVGCTPPREFLEVKGPRNAHIPLQHPDLGSLRLALGMSPTEPPPPPSATPRALTLEELLELIGDPGCPPPRLSALRRLSMTSPPLRRRATGS